MLALRRFDQQIRAFVRYMRVPTPAAMAASRRAFHHKTIRRPEDRRIFTISPDE
jgi:hypothetical protein